MLSNFVSSLFLLCVWESDGLFIVWENVALTDTALDHCETQFLDICWDATMSCRKKLRQHWVVDEARPWIVGEMRLWVIEGCGSELLRGRGSGLLRDVALIHLEGATMNYWDVVLIHLEGVALNCWETRLWIDEGKQPWIDGRTQR